MQTSKMDLDVKLRYLPILEEINCGTVLEVGSGVKGIARFLDKEIVGCDVKFEGEPLPNLRTVEGSVVDLPFGDQTFDYVVSSDMLEHLDKEDREKALKEMIRVARRRVVVGFPCGKKSARYEKKLFDLFKLVTGREHRWIKEHIENGLPSEMEIMGYLEDEDVVVKGNFNLKLWFVNELFNPWFWFVPWIGYSIFNYHGGDTYRKIFIINK